MVQLYQVDKIPVGRIAPPPVQVMNKRRTPGRTKHRRIPTKLHIVRVVAGMLGKLCRCRRHYGLAAKAGDKPHPRSRHIASGIGKNRQYLGIILKLHPCLGKDLVRIGLDLLQPRIAQDVEGRELAQDERRSRLNPWRSVRFVAVSVPAGRFHGATLAESLTVPKQIHTT